MTTIPSHASPEDQAAAWVVRLHEGDPTDADFVAFEDWLTAAPGRASAFDRAERLWRELGDRRLGLLAEIDAQDRARRDGRAPNAGSGGDIIALAARRRPRARVWIGAGIAAAAVAIALPLGWRFAAPSAQNYSTAHGETRVIALADGSVLRLNTATRIKAQISADARRITLIDGEASFDVAHDGARPFTVRVGDQEVRDVGTEFDLARHDGRIALTVRAGAVDVRPAGATGAPAARLKAGETLKRAEGSPVWTVAAAQTEDAFAWTRGYLIYRDAPLAEVAADLSRYSQAPIRVDPSARGLHFSGVLQIDRPDAMLRRLEAFAPVQVDRADDAVTLRSRS